MAIVGFPDGTRVRASSISDRRVDDPERTFGLYLNPRWQPTWPGDRNPLHYDDDLAARSRFGGIIVQAVSPPGS